MIQKLTLTSVYRTQKDKTGKELKTKDGKPYTRVLIKCSEHGENLLSGFGGQWNQSWQEGDEVSVEVSKVEKNGKTFLNFSKVNTEAHLLAQVSTITNEIASLRSRVAELEKINKTYSRGVTSTGDKVPDFTEVDMPDDIDSEEIPFN